MSRVILDANVIIRFITGDDKEKQEKAARLFEQIKKGEITAFIHDVIFAEIVFVLVSKKLYNLSKSKIRSLLLPIINLPHIKFINKNKIKRALDIFVQFNVDFEDAVIAAYSESKNIEILTFDDDFKKIPNISSKQP
ncbi:PIN domain-containing protein [Candidatus Roizmanbacteria bacterium]|nr:PIN domain-containing protein [Candidatus Roizmanbacteria bacterium]